MINQFAYYKPTCELIDTLWNVNAVEFASSLVTP